MSGVLCDDSTLPECLYYPIFGDALRDLLRSRGLTPHPRGDASMLLWQVRNRLGLNVGQVDM